MKYAFLLLALVCQFAVFAQHSPNGESRTTSVTRERLIGYSFHIPPSNPVATDTVIYYYSGENGSDTVGPNFYLTPQVIAPNHQTIKCDSYILKIGGFVRGIYTYNTSGDAVTYKYDDTTGSGTGTLMPHRYSGYTCASGFISADSQWATTYSFNRYYFYDFSGFLVRDSITNPATLLPTGKTEYVNNAAGAVLSSTGYVWSAGTWVAASRTLNTYDGSNRLTNSLRQSYSSSTWNNYRKDSFYYAVPGNKYSYTAYALWTSGVWVPNVAYAYHFNGANQWDTVYTYSWNTSGLSFDTGAKQYIIYDGFGNITSSGDIVFRPSSHVYADTAYELNRYFYETYSSTVRVNTTVPVTGT